ncbi:MAG: glycerophosphodiester phosphodiesterase [Lentisphaeria bacterium]|nr:glycerophosphodiester phosphodiesterase [Lentisphaeria bacterium]
MKWISHRGESCDAPENTLPAFALSLERNTDGMECDIHLTKDGVLVTNHDSNTLRTSGVESIIEESIFADLQKLDVCYDKKSYSPCRIPLFRDTLQFLGKNRVYYVEIKEDDPRVIPAMVEELEKAEIPPEQIVMISFKRNIVKLFKEAYPERKALFLTSFRVFENGTWTPSADALIEELKELKADGVDIHGNLTFLSKEYVQKVKEAGFSFAVWTIDEVETAKRFVEFGVDAITSNCAAHLKQLIEQKGI